MSRTHFRTRWPAWAALLAFGCASCNIINPKEKTPTYVTLDSFQFQSIPETGTANQKITSAFVYLDNAFVGVFALPATFPILSDKAGELTIAPGVTYSGLSDFQLQYPYFRSYKDTLTPGQYKRLAPATAYWSKDAANFLIEDFELGNKFVFRDGDTTLDRVVKPELVLEGASAGYVYLRAPQTFSESVMTDAFTAKTDCYIELNYKGTIPFEVGLFATSNSGAQDQSSYFIGFRPRDNWTKVYIGTQDFLNAYPNRSYRMLIRALLPGGQSEGALSIDNVKILTKK